ncbi:hypothetical protein PTT_14025 [Pyrenophora teres f. teres 0-1]|uniref:F-box domain-containing protein n=1 Tax=Pyrenophora teres f. teres (strain 0-1) TaxID=861557 RepID=E3RXC1_PYRTT|nr:hypothetical protein PTT_14025 [Pyrenophora teres f. teres 0-1]
MPRTLSPFSRLPSELVLQICDHLKPYDLWFNARPISRLLATCANEILLRKIFAQDHVHFSWCCFWCGLGPLSLDTALKDIIPLFSDKAKVHMSCMADKSVLAKLVLGHMSGMVLHCDQKIRFRIGEEDDVEMSAQELQNGVQLLPRDLQLRQYKSMAVYFKRLEREKRRWPVAVNVSFITHVLGITVTVAALLLAIVAVLVVFCPVFEAWRMGKALCGMAISRVRACLWKGSMTEQRDGKTS